MVIEGTFYRLTPISESSPRFDLELLYDIGGKNPRKEFKVEGYGYSLEAAIQRIIHYSIRKKYKDDEVITLKEYIDEYKQESSKIRSAIEGKAQ